jgi:O-succinylbenzoate synthase
LKTNINTDLHDKITTITQIQMDMPLVHPFRTSFGEQTSIQSIVIKVEDENENVGWGETCVSKDPGYCYETTVTAKHIQDDFLIPRLKRLVTDNETLSILDLLNNWEPIRGHEFAKGGIEAALWCLKAEQEKTSLRKIYGGVKTTIPTGVSIGIQPSIEALLQRINQFINKGYQRIKIKIEPGWDVQVIKSIRNEFGDVPLMVDANSAYSLSDKHIQLLKELDKFDLMMIEQPLSYHDMLEHKKLQELITTPVCLDESIHNPRDAELALEFACCKIINVKPGRVGGFYNAIQIAENAGQGKVWCGGMLENGIGRIHNLCLQSREEYTIPGDTSGSDRYYAKDIIDPPVIVDEKGFIQVPTQTGLGVEVLENQINTYSVSSTTHNLS